MSHEFGNENHEKPYIDGSFILQPWPKEEHAIYSLNEGNQKVKLNYSPQQYFGAYPDKFAEDILFIQMRKCGKKDCQAKTYKKFSSKLKKWADRDNDENGNRNGKHENRIGILAVNPELNNLPYLMQMIMEKHFGLYKEKCWLCGYDYKKDNVELKRTRAGYPKFHIKCGYCGDRTVETHCRNSNQKGHAEIKLGKHFVNYYAQENSSRWNVSCPFCRDLAGDEGERPVNGCKQVNEPFADAQGHFKEGMNAQGLYDLFGEYQNY